MAEPKKYDTPLLDELEKGAFPSFVTEIKRMAERKPMAADLLGQLEKSYRDKIGYWKHGGLVGVMGYGGGVIGRYSAQNEEFPEVSHFHTLRVNQPSGWFYNTEKLLAGGAYVGIATHDSHLVWAGMSAIDRLQLDRDQYEFQMLLGVDPDLRKIILAEGHRLRVYVPFGRDWYPYSMRRLRENPSVARHVMRAMLPFSRPV